MREAWDSDAYFTIGLAVMAIGAATAGVVAPSGVWRWPIWIVAGHGLAMALIHPPVTSLGLLPLTVVFAGLPLVLLLIIPAIIGAIVARRGWDRAIIVRI